MKSTPAAAAGAGALALFFVLALTMTGAASAQQVPTPANETAADPAAECTEHITEDLSICSAELDGDEAVLELYADRPARLVITDGSFMILGGQARQKTVHAEGRTTVRMPVEVVDARAAISISGSVPLYGVVVKDPPPNPFGQVPPTAGWLGGASVVAVMTGLGGRRVMKNQPEEPETME